MKKSIRLLLIIGVLALLEALPVEAQQQSYSLQLSLSSFSGKFSTNDSTEPFKFTAAGYTLFLQAAVLDDRNDDFTAIICESDQGDNCYLGIYGIYGNILWSDTNRSSGYLLGAMAFASEDGKEIFASYLDGTLKLSKGKYTVSATCGQSGIGNNGLPYRMGFSIKGTGKMQVNPNPPANP